MLICPNKTNDGFTSCTALKELLKDISLSVRDVSSVNHRAILDVLSRCLLL